MKKLTKTMLIASIPIILISIGIFIYLTKYIKENKQESTGYYLELETNYVEDNKWEYTIKGLLPNSCYKYSITPITPDSRKEQIYITADISVEGPETCVPKSCEQIVEANGFFNASKNAKIEFLYDRIE